MADAFHHFEETFARAQSQIKGSHAILNLFNDTLEERKDEYTYSSLHEASDMGRFGIVLAVASMDDFFTRKYAEVMVQAVKRHGVNPKFTAMLEEAGLDIAGALELIALSRPYRRIRAIAQKHYRNYTTQSTKKIDDLFATIGIKDLCTHAQKRADRKSLLTSVNAIVKRRHQIVHAGDLTQTGKLVDLNQAMIKKVEHLRIFVEYSNEHIDAFMKQKPKQK